MYLGTCVKKQGAKPNFCGRRPQPTKRIDHASPTRRRCAARRASDWPATAQCGNGGALRLRPMTGLRASVSTTSGNARRPRRPVAVVRRVCSLLPLALSSSALSQMGSSQAGVVAATAPAPVRGGREGRRRGSAVLLLAAPDALDGEPRFCHWPSSRLRPSAADLALFRGPPGLGGVSYLGPAGLAALCLAGRWMSLAGWL